MVDVNEIDQRVLKAMGGRKKLLVLLEDAGFPTIKDVAKATGEWPQDVSGCLRGEREYPSVRNAIAELLNIDRSLIDQLLVDSDSAVATADA